MRRHELGGWYERSGGRSEGKVERYSRPSRDVFESVSKVHVDAIVGLHPECAILIDKIAGNLKARMDTKEGDIISWVQVGAQLYDVVSLQTPIQEGPMTPDEVREVVGMVRNTYDNVPSEELKACAYQVMWSYVGNIALSGLI